MVQFNKLEKVEIGGTKGKDLSESVRLICSISMVYWAPVVGIHECLVAFVRIRHEIPSA